MSKSVPFLPSVRCELEVVEKRFNEQGPKSKRSSTLLSPGSGMAKERSAPEHLLANLHFEVATGLIYGEVSSLQCATTHSNTWPRKGAQSERRDGTMSAQDTCASCL